MKFNMKSLLKFQEFYLKSQEYKATPVWIITEDYMSEISSFIFIENWLSFQFENDEEAATRFVKDLYNWLNMVVKKKCIFAMVGEPNCGKSFMALAICSLRGPYGTMRSMYKGNNFPFESLVDQCTGFMDDSGEICSKFVSTLKDMSGGNGGGFINQKGKAAAWVKAMPLMFTSNDENIFNTSDGVWASRVYRYILKPIRTKDNIWTKETVEKKLNPNAFIHLFRNYNLLNF